MANPLTLLMPVLPGTSLLTIAAALEGSQKQIDAALANVGTVHFARFLLLDRSQPNLQPKLNSIISSDSLVIGVVTEYDGNFDAYIKDFVAQLGGVFDKLLSFVVGGAALIPVVNHVAGFNAFITTNDASQHLPNSTLYSAYPQTVQQILAAF
jgi:hypothetical protein